MSFGVRLTPLGWLALRNRQGAHPEVWVPRQTTWHLQQLHLSLLMAIKGGVVVGSTAHSLDVCFYILL
jgi:hypothetical protein